MATVPPGPSEPASRASSPMAPGSGLGLGPQPVPRCAPSPFAVFASCPHCDGDMAPEHAHYRCTACGWRDSCCD